MPTFIDIAVDRDENIIGCKICVRLVYIRQDLGDYNVMDQGNGRSLYQVIGLIVISDVFDLWQIVRPFIYEIIIKLVFKLIIYEIVQ